LTYNFNILKKDDLEITKEKNPKEIKIKINPFSYIHEDEYDVNISFVLEIK
jgi:hypothetical protein